MRSFDTPTLMPDLIWQVLDDNAVIISPKEGDVRVLNGVGTVIWQLLTQQTAVGDIEACLVDQYSISAAQARHDLHLFLTDLTNRGLLTWPT